MPFPDFSPRIPEFIRTRLESYADRPLVLLKESRLSYGEAADLSAKLARGLLAAVGGKGTRVGLLMPNGPQWVLAWLAATRIGAVLVPLNTFCRGEELC